MTSLALQPRFDGVRLDGVGLIRSIHAGVPYDCQLRALPMHFMIIERFRDRDPVPVYRRFRDRGRMAPEGVRYVGSWVTPDLSTCYQVMDCDDRALLDAWIANWQDIVDFEIIPVITSPEAAARVAPRL